MNQGKRFEKAWKESVPEDVYYLRLNDPAQSFGGGKDQLRFSPKNPFDNLLYRYPMLMAIELKTTANTSFSFWREDFKARGVMLKREQVLGLLRAHQHYGVVAGFVLNFRRTMNTYFLPISAFKAYTDSLDKKSINEDDVRAAGAIVIGCRKLKTNYRYDIGGLFDEARTRILDCVDRTDNSGNQRTIAPDRAALRRTGESVRQADTLPWD